jgi:hypothetical protein
VRLPGTNVPGYFQMSLRDKIHLLSTNEWRQMHEAETP